MSAAPLDLRAWKRVAPPKFKKDYPGKTLRVTTQHMRERYERVDGQYQYVTGPDALLPPNAVLSLRARYTNGVNSEGQSQAILTCDWLCPCCGHKHERQFPEALLAAGKIEFVEEDSLGVAPEAILYLACPYTADDPKLRQDRWLAVSRAAAWLMGTWKYTVLSPVSMGHPISVAGGIAHDFTAWEKTSLALLDAATHLVVLLLPGVYESVGVRAEIDFARKKGLPIWTLQEDAQGAQKLDRLPATLPGDTHEQA